VLNSTHISKKTGNPSTLRRILLSGDSPWAQNEVWAHTGVIGARPGCRRATIVNFSDIYCSTHFMAVMEYMVGAPTVPAATEKFRSGKCH
jgi:hypothetical protein